MQKVIASAPADTGLEGNIVTSSILFVKDLGYRFRPKGFAINRSLEHVPRLGR